MPKQKTKNKQLQADHVSAQTDDGKTDRPTKWFLYFGSSVYKVSSKMSNISSTDQDLET